jgi:DNA-binding NarL/FixJ family response regulator
MKKDIQLLIVDDSLIIVARLFNLLADQKNISGIYYAKAYEDAELFFSKLVPDVMLLDINLSLNGDSKNGIDLLRYLKKHNYSTKVVVITNEANPYYKELCVSLGADYFLDKSKDFEYIPGIISHL